MNTKLRLATAINEIQVAVSRVDTDSGPHYLLRVIDDFNVINHVDVFGSVAEVRGALDALELICESTGSRMRVALTRAVEDEMIPKAH